MSDEAKKLLEKILGKEGYRKLEQKVIKKTKRIFNSIEYDNFNFKEYTMNKLKDSKIILPKDIEQYIKNLRDDYEEYSDTTKFAHYSIALIIEFLEAFKTAELKKNLWWEFLGLAMDKREEKIKEIKRYFKSRIQYYDVKAFQYVQVNGKISWDKYKELQNTILWRKGKKIKYLLNKLNNVKQPKWEDCALHHENPYSWEHLFSESYLINKSDHKRGGNLLKSS